MGGQKQHLQPGGGLELVYWRRRRENNLQWCLIVRGKLVTVR